MATTVYVMRFSCVFFLIYLAAINSQRIEDSLGVSLEQDEIIDEELDNTYLDEDNLLEESTLLKEKGVSDDGFHDANEAKNPDSPSNSPVSSGPPPNLRIVENFSDNVEHNIVPSYNVNYSEYQGTNEDDTDEHALVTAFFVTTMSELGDKTFFMCAILAMHHSRTLTLIGATIGQTIMTLVAVFFGMLASLVPDVYTQWASAIIMTFFGLKMLRDGANMDDSPDGKSNSLKAKTLEKQVEKNEQTKEEAESKEIKTDENDNNEVVTKEGKENNGDVKPLDCKKNGVVKNLAVLKKTPEYTKGVLLQATTLCLMGEWGDKSQIATILMASNEDPYMVAAGGVLGHILCNVVAVFGGRMIASKFPAKIVTQVGGVFFLIAAVSSFFFS